MNFNFFWGIALLLLSCSDTETGFQELSLIYEDDRFGYINEDGKVIIKPVFRSAGEFSEGLAPVRHDGLFGYINPKGKLIISEQFDFALSFSEGLAIVYLDGKPECIGHDGQKVFASPFIEMSSFKNGRSMVKTSTGKAGIINKKGVLVIDTIFRKINEFKNGAAVVEGLDHLPITNINKNTNSDLEIGVIDTSGNFIIPYGISEYIGDCSDGFFSVTTGKKNAEIDFDDYESTCIYDMKGNLVLSENLTKGNLGGDVHCGMVSISKKKKGISEREDLSYDESYYWGYMNLEGRIIFNDSSYRDVSDFSENRAFVQLENKKYIALNIFGKAISSDTFNMVPHEGFQNGIASVRIGKHVGIIDTNGVFLIKPDFSVILTFATDKNHFAYKQLENDDIYNHSAKCGIARIDGTILTEPIIDYYDESGYKNGLLRCKIDDRLSYINKNGKIVWQESMKKRKRLENYNIDFMKNGYFKVYPDPELVNKGTEGVKLSFFSKSIVKNDVFKNNSISISVLPEHRETFNSKFNGIKVYVANLTSVDIDFNSQDCRLNLKAQAKDKKGEWKDIENLPESWCGNSYGITTLRTGRYWEFITPVYEGVFDTKRRLVLTYIDPKDHNKSDYKKNEITVYSNEYFGSINPAQFWHKNYNRWYRIENFLDWRP